MTTPVSNLADGNVKVTFVDTLTSTTSPSAAELNAGTDLSCYLTADGYTPGVDETVISDDRLCSTQTFEKPGRYSDTLTLTYVFRAQDAAGSDNLAFHALTHLTTGYLVVRWGAAYDDAFAATDVVDVIPVQAGIQQKQPPEANSVLKITQRMFITNAVERDAVAAA
jgi:hypothetical protein